MSAFNMIKYGSGIGVAAALLAMPVQAQSLTTPGAKPPTVKSVSLWYTPQSKTACPRKIMMRARAETNGPGSVRFVIRKAGGGKSGTLSAKAEKQADGKYIATYTQTFDIKSSTTTKYMAEAVGSGKVSAWIDFDVKCGAGVKESAKTTGAPGPKGRPLAEQDKGKPVQTGDSRPSGNGKRICKGNIEVTRVLVVSQDIGLLTATLAWEQSARASHGDAYGNFDKAADRKRSCKGLIGSMVCKVSGRPCHK